jgi:hypothetical protein
VSDGDDTLANTRLPSLEKDSDGFGESPRRRNNSVDESEPLLVQEATMIEMKSVAKQQSASKSG